MGPSSFGIDLRPLGESLTSRNAAVFYHWVVITVVAAAALWHLNVAPVIVAVLWLVWYGVANSWCDTGRLFNFSERARKGRQTFFASRWECFWVVTLPVGLLFLSSFLYVPSPWDYQIIERQGGQIEYHEGVFVTTFYPLSDVVYNFGADQSVKSNMSPPSCGAVSQDGRSVQASLTATLRLPFEGLPATYSIAGTREKLKEMTRGELCGAFAAAVHQHPLAELGNLVVLEAGTGEDNKGMNKMGVLYNGPIEVWNLHALVVQER